MLLQKMKSFFKMLLEKENRLRTILFGVVVLLLFICLFAPILRVDKAVSSSYTSYQLQVRYIYQTVYTYQCNYVWTYSGYMYQCTYMPTYQLTPVYEYVPYWSYTTTYFTNDVHLYDLLVSTFGLHAKQLFITIPFLLGLFSLVLLSFTDSKKLRKLGLGATIFLNIIISGSLIALIRVKLVNPDETHLTFFFLLLLIAQAVLLVYTFLVLDECKRKHQEDYIYQSSIFCTYGNLSLLVRLGVCSLLLVLGEVSISSLYGFLFFIALLIGLFISLDDKKVKKIVGIILSTGVCIYSLTTFILIIIKGIQKDIKLSKLVSFDGVLFRLLDILVLVAVVWIIIKEYKQLKQVENHL